MDGCPVWQQSMFSRQQYVGVGINFKLQESMS